MIKHRVLLQALLCLVLIAGNFIENAVAGIRPIVTAKGDEISPVHVQDRLVRLLRELGEPTWSKKEVKRMMGPVFSYLRAFTGRQFERTLAALKRGDKYRPMIQNYLKQHKLPLSLEALPMAESAFRYNARSNQGAYGLWQFMPASARRYDLHVSSRMDERADPVRATRAAVKYLKHINKKFGHISILLSVAAYNAGEGRIQGVVRKSGISRKARGYSRIVRFLPKETRGYVPEFLAAALILKNPAYFGFPVSKTKNYGYLQLQKAESVDQLIKLTRMSRDELYKLNPELDRRKRTPTNNFILRLPQKRAIFLKKGLPDSVVWQAVANPIELERPVIAKKHLVYTVRTGNHLGGIAKLFKVDVNQLRKWNKLKGNSIKAGQRIIIQTKKPLLRKFYRIKPGDNLGLIAQTLGISIDHLKFINGVNNPRRLKVGNRLFYYDYQV
jgi:peptidoglycan lytic transglycosylase D